MVNGFVAIAIESFLAVVTVASVGVVTTLDADSAADVSRQLVQLHVEATLACMEVTVARWITTEQRSSQPFASSLDPLQWLRWKSRGGEVYGHVCDPLLLPLAGRGPPAFRMGHYHSQDFLKFSLPIITNVSVWHRVSKNCAKLFCQNFVKFPPILIIFGRKMAKQLKIMQDTLIFHLT